MNFLTDILNPDKYHGHGRNAPFFEGWYYKLISRDEKAKFAIIPGVILGKSSHAFIQLLDGSTRSSIYRVFPLDAFMATEEKFEVSIGGNQFTRDRIWLDIDDQDGTLQGELSFEGLTPWPVSILSPGIMGWYAWVPKMETYHGVVSLNHHINGMLNINHEDLDFSGGLGYIEKDWGAAFPAAYIWFQTNHFEQEGTSITASTAIIPWMRSAFRGFICGLWHQGQLYRFATYTRARMEDLKVFEDHIEWVLRDRRYRLEMRASRPQGGSLLGPDRVEMGKRIVETMSSTVEVRLSTLSGQEIFAGVGRHAGLEAHGDLDRLLTMQ
jgi:tocopherol cyclase